MIRYVLISMIVLFIGCNGTSTKTDGGGGDKPAPTKLLPHMAELKSMMEKSKEIAEKLESVRKQPESEDDEYQLYLESRTLDSTHMVALERILDKEGWIDQSRYGVPISNFVLNVIKNAPPAKQQKYLDTVLEKMKSGEASGALGAQICDQVLISQGKNQRYGTQLSFNESKGINDVHPIEDAKNVDRRRAEVGLEPMASYWKRFGIIYKPEE